MLGAEPHGSDKLRTAGGLAATSLINIAFGASNAYLWFCVLWGMNGLLQARILTHYESHISVRQESPTS